MAPSNPVRRGLRQPAVRFALIGAVLYGLHGYLRPPVSAPGELPEPLVLRAADIREQYAQRFGAPPTAEQETALLADAADELILARSARELGLDAADSAIRGWLIQKMRFVATEGEAGLDDDALHQRALELGMDREDLVIRRILAEKMRSLASQPPRGDALTEEELLDFLARHPDRYRRPARLSLIHVFVAKGPKDLDRARALHARLEHGRTEPRAAVELGDPFPLGHDWHGRSEAQLAKQLGPDGSGAAFACQPERWCEPLRSPYGLHLLWISEKHEARDATLEDVRSQVVEARRTELRKARLEAFMAELREQYTVVVEDAAGA